MILESSLHFGVLKCRLLFDGRENSGAGCAVSAAPCLADFGNTVPIDGKSSLHFSPMKVQAACGALDVFPKQPVFFARRRSGAAI